MMPDVFTRFDAVASVPLYEVLEKLPACLERCPAGELSEWTAERFDLMASLVRSKLAEYAPASAPATDALEAAARKATPQGASVAALERLVMHCWLHSGYADCGYSKMTTSQKALYDGILARSGQIAAGGATPHGAADAADAALGRAIREFVDWGVATFQQSTPHTTAAHLAKEVAELQADPTDGSEYADCLGLLCHGARRAGVDLVQALNDKLAVNKARKWGKPNAQGFVEHVREGEPQRASEATPEGHAATEAHCTHRCLDEHGEPRGDEHGTLSLWGRVLRFATRCQQWAAPAWSDTPPEAKASKGKGFKEPYLHLMGLFSRIADALGCDADDDFDAGALTEAIVEWAKTGKRPTFKTLTAELPPEPVQPHCGHPPSSVNVAEALRGGTVHCTECEREAKKAGGT